jgi:stage IV sporulation protein A
MENIYQDIAARTGGNIYIGVVGPVRTGKSTLIKRIMEQWVIPAIDDPYRKERARDELPQSGSGRTIMTSEPKFVPEEAVEISPDGTAKLSVRMIDSVGYMVNGAVGAEENGVPRMVTTPWYDYEIPMTEAAELGTKKVMQEHCSIGIVVTTDGTVTDIPREDYLDAEARAIRDMQATGKPFLCIINSRSPMGDAAAAVKESLKNQFGIDATIADCQALDVGAIAGLLRELLYHFPMRQLQVYLPRWMDALEPDHPVKAALYQALLTQANQIRTLGQAKEYLLPLKELEQVTDFSIRDVDLGSGTVSCALGFPEELFYQILGDKTGHTLSDEGELFDLLVRLSAMEQKYERIREAMDSVNRTGYGIVMPDTDELTLEEPEISRQNGKYGIRLKASAPSIHMLRADITTEVAPIVGTEKQSEELVQYLMNEFNEDPAKLWGSNIFGKSLNDLVSEGLRNKLYRMPEEARMRLKETLEKIINEGCNALICIIL